MRVRNMISRNSGREVANQFIIESDGKKVFQSYSSEIAELDFNNNVITIYPDYNYSTTTGKYRNQFFDESGLYGLATIDGLRKAIREGKYGWWKIQLS